MSSMAQAGHRRIAIPAKLASATRLLYVGGTQSIKYILLAIMPVLLLAAQPTAACSTSIRFFTELSNTFPAITALKRTKIQCWNSNDSFDCLPN